MRRELRALLGLITCVEQPWRAKPAIDYAMRERLVLAALAAARASGLEAGVRLDPAEPEWPVVFIELPTGQVSWHLPQHATPWDGHTTAEKYARIGAYLEARP